MRIAQIVPVIRVGGILHHLRVLSKLRPQFDSIYVCLFDANDDAALQKLQPNVVNLRLPPKMYANRKLVQEALQAALLEIEPDTVHSHHNFSDWYAIPVAHDLGLNAIRTVHGITQRDVSAPLIVASKKLDWSAEEKSRQLSLDPFVARTLAVSAHLRSQLVSYGFPLDKVSVLYPGVDLDVTPFHSFGQSGSDDEVFYIAFPHRLEPIKNPGLMVQVIEGLSKSGVQVHVYVPRTGTLLRDTEIAIDRLGLGPAVEWLVPGVDIWKQIPRADVLLLTSFSEGLPVTALEAMARSIPIVAPRVCGIPEAVADGETGFLIEDETCNAYVEALQALARNRSLCRSLGAAGRHVAVSRFSLDLHLQNLSSVYRSLGATP